MPSPTSRRELEAFLRIDFGDSAAETESSRRPALLLDGFLDLHGLGSEILDTPRFLILGRKGVGKSSVFANLALRSESDPQLFVEACLLGDFAFSQFAELVPGSTDGLARYPLAWRLLLLLEVFASIGRDEGSSISTSANLSAILAALRQRGLIPSAELGALVERVSAVEFGLKIPGVGAKKTTSDTHRDASVKVMVQTLERALGEFSSESFHYILIDGLDDIFLASPLQFETIIALISQAAHLNAEFRGRGLPVKILVACRADVYERLPGANTNKLRQDAGIDFDWYEEGGEATSRTSSLASLANMKASVSLGETCDLFDRFFADAHTDSYNLGTRGTIEWILAYTRFTPRDFLQALKQIQTAVAKEPELAFRPSQQTGESALVHPEHVRKGLERYARAYFVPEIKNELSGSISHETIEAGLSVLTISRSWNPTLGELELARTSDYGLREIDMPALLRALYDAGAVGSVWSSRPRRLTTFRYQNEYSYLDLQRPVGLHRALAAGIGLPGSPF